MKKRHLLFLAALTITCLSGCGKDKVDPTEPSPTMNLIRIMQV